MSANKLPISSFGAKLNLDGSFGPAWTGSLGDDINQEQQERHDATRQHIYSPIELTMGVVVSSPTPTSPFFLATGIIGIVSFVFTLGTFFKVVWVNLDTINEAPHEVHAYLTNLRTELLEEKASLRLMRKGMKKHRRMTWRENGGSVVGMELDEVTLKTMSDNIRHLIKRFRDLV